MQTKNENSDQSDISYTSDMEPEVISQKKKDKLKKKLKSKVTDYLEDEDEKGLLFENRKTVLETDCHKPPLKKSVSFADNNSIIPDHQFITPMVLKDDAYSSASKTSIIQSTLHEKDDYTAYNGNDILESPCPLLKKASEHQVTPHPKSKSRVQDESDEESGKNSANSKGSKGSLKLNFNPSRSKNYCSISPLFKKSVKDIFANKDVVDMKSQSESKPCHFIKLTFSDLKDDTNSNLPSQDPNHKFSLSEAKLPLSKKFESQILKIDEESYDKDSLNCSTSKNKINATFAKENNDELKIKSIKSSIIKANEV